MAERVDEPFRQLASIDASAALSLWKLYLAGTGHERDEARELLEILLFQAANKDYRERIFLNPPPADECSGDYPIGTVLYPPDTPFAPFGLREDEWTSHVLITGMTGKGKTVLTLQILQALAGHGKPFLVFDWKRNYRDLRQLPQFRNLRVYTVGQDTVPLRFNPLQPPPGVPAGEWLMKLVDVIKHAYFVGDGVEYVLRRVLDELYEDSGYFSPGPARQPTFEEALVRVRTLRLRGRMALWKASALRVLESLCFRHGLGPVVNTGAWAVPQLFEGNVVLELDALSDVDKVFLTEALILWLYEFRKRHGRREHFQHALVIEEAHHILSERKERTSGAETIMESCLRQIREFGEAVVIVDQEPSKLSGSIKANTATKITFALGNGRDIADIAGCLGLNEEETRYLRLLTTGYAVVGQRGRIATPILIRVQYRAIQKGRVTDADLRST